MQVERAEREEANTITALKPIENRRVRGVAAERYPSNLICAHPDCDKPVDLRPDGTPTVHHIFPRSLTKSDSYFVQFWEDEEITVPPSVAKELGRSTGVHPVYSEPIPHAVGLCGSGTTGHHGDVEEHRAWIKLEDGEYVWYDRAQKTYASEEEALIDRHENGSDGTEWVRVGPLNPQPGSREGKPKRKRTQKGTPERAARKTISVRLPEGVDGDYWDSLLSDAENIELSQEDTQFDKARGGIAVGKLLVAILERFTGRND